MTSIRPRIKLLRLPAVLELVPYSRPNIYRLMAAGKFPKPVHLGRAVAWLESEVDDWVQQRLAARDGSSPVGGQVINQATGRKHRAANHEEGKHDRPIK